ncbi:MAG: hypothetical protein FJ267_09315 [Planctomycetes bacterium]|nr:hypothetical protein [Planctomycetota bacterium]
MLEVVLFLLGLCCLGLEMFVIPGFGVFGVSGILLVIAALVMAGNTWTFDTPPNIQQLTRSTGQVLLSLATVIVMGIFALRYLPRIPMFDSMILGPPGSEDDPAEPKLRVETVSTENESVNTQGVKIGQHGETLTMLRPSGKARLNDRVVDVVSEGPFINPNIAVEVVSITGNKITVKMI